MVPSPMGGHGPPPRPSAPGAAARTPDGGTRDNGPYAHFPRRRMAYVHMSAPVTPRLASLLGG